jgi:hypothetical protein
MHSRKRKAPSPDSEDSDERDELKTDDLRVDSFVVGQLKEPQSGYLSAHDLYSTLLNCFFAPRADFLFDRNDKETCVR